MKKTTVEDLLPLSPFQAGLYFHAEFERTGPDAYSVQYQLHLEGLLSIDSLWRAAADVLASHSALRASFRTRRNGDPVQVIHRTVPLESRIHDLTDVPPHQRERRAKRVLRAELERRFELQRPPLIRFVVVKLAEDRHILAAVNHHIILDGWSTPLLLQELLARYSAAEAGQRFSSVRAPQVRDYYEWLIQQDRATAIQAWRAALSGVEEATLVNMGENGNAQFEPIRLTRETPSVGLQRLAKSLGITVNTVWQAIWGAAISALTGHTDVVFGGVVSGRSAEIARVDEMVGLLINTVPVRVSFDPTEPVSAMLQRLHREQGEMLGHHHVGLVDIHSELGVERLFDSVLLVQNYPFDEDSSAKINGQLKLVDLAVMDGAHYPLRMVVVPSGTVFRWHLDARGVLNYGELTQLADRIEELLTALPQDPSTREWHAYGPADNASRRHGPVTTVPDLSLSDLLHAQYLESPDDVAVRCAGSELSYRELHEQGHVLEKCLIKRGIGPESLVGVVCRRSTELMVALVGILRAGAAYLPLDPSDPPNRTKILIEGAQPEIILLGSNIKIPDLPVPVPVPVLVIGDVYPADVGYAESIEAPVRVNPDHPAYVLFTSGSTGRPKGVIVSNRSIVNRLIWMQDRYQLSSADVVLQKTPLGFDVSVWELFWPLICGARLELARPDGHRDPVYLAELIRSEGVTVSHFVPPMLREFLSMLPAEGCPTLRLTICSGSVLDPATVKTAIEKLQGRLDNLYGPTEAAVDVTAWTCSTNRLQSIIPIGAPVWNTSVAVLDRFLRPVPQGVVGELYLSGVQLARGYKSQPSMTSDRFVADPSGSGTRMYRTGDRVRLTAARELEYLGRTDDQVKIRGMRIDPGEVEAVLVGISGVVHAAVVVREVRRGDPQLVGYIEVGVQTDLDTVRSTVLQQLPAHMIPEHWVVIDTFPLTANGKPDRRSLPAPLIDGSGELPTSKEEALLCDLFAEVLGLDSVGADQDFFTLGGHSLLAMRLVARSLDATEIALDLQQVFELRTPQRLASASNTKALLPPLRARGIDEPDVASPGQRRLWFIDRLQGPSGIYNLAFSLELEGEIDVAALRRAAIDIALRHESLRTTFSDNDGVPLPQLHSELGVTLDVRRVAESELEATITAIATQPFRIADELPLRLSLLQTDSRHAVLVAVVHHIAADGWSLGLLSRDIGLAYAAQVSGQSPSWAPFTVTYGDYAGWQHELLDDISDEASVAGSQASYWTTALSGAPDLISLPTDRPRPPVATHSGAVVPVSLDADTVGILTRWARDAGATLFMALHTILVALLQRAGAGDDIVVGSPVAGRTQAGLEDLVGFFVNTLVLRVDASGRPTYSELLERVRTTDLGAFSNQDLPFEQLVELLNPPRSRSRSPLFQVMLVLQNAPETKLELPEISLNAKQIHTNTSKFDLTFELGEEADGSLQGHLEFATDLFDEKSAEQFARMFSRLGERVASDPGVRLAEPDLLTEAERTMELRRSRGEELPRPSANSVAQMFELAVQKNPGSYALVDHTGDVLTYQQLNHAADELCYELVSLHIGPGDLVGLALPRTRNLIVAVLAVLKTGAAYVPIDLNYPDDRVRFMIEDSAPAIIIGTLKANIGIDVPSIDPFVHPVSNNGILRREDIYRKRVVRGQDPAYVIYTSGSTGKPKGVLVSNQAVVNLLAGMASTLSIDMLRHGIASTSLSFDVSVFEILAPLVSGGSIELRDDLLGLLNGASGVTLVSGVPSALGELAASKCMPEGLRAVLFAGEPLTSSTLKVTAGESDCAIFNVYGPTESTVYSLIWKASAGKVPLRVPIGRPLPGVRAYILDDLLRPTVSGLVGELYLAGEQVAIGYFNQSALTAERFVADPFGPPGCRMYRTGDLARWNIEGHVEYFGRQDQQVKVRGYRIELGEIEAVVESCAGVRKAVIKVWDDATLAAYFVPEHGHPADVEAMAATAALSLPDYMVPTSWTMLSSLPLSVNGKLDRGALPKPEAIVPTLCPPRNDIEANLCKLFADVLECAEVGIDDGFFDLGGHSLLAVNLIGRIRDELDYNVDLPAFFAAPTVRAAEKGWLTTVLNHRPTLRRYVSEENE